MRSQWSDDEAERVVAHYAIAGIGRDLATRVYTTRLLGSDKRLVLHGGGNTSLKTTLPDLLGEPVEVLCVKGSGRDMAAIDPAGMPPIRLAPLRRLRERETLSDEDMVRVQRANLLDPDAPTPSVETLLHAFLPHKFIDHTHATPVLSLTDQPDGAARCAEAFAGHLGIVPYVRPGLPLGKVAADVFDADPAVDGLILLKHGIFTFGDTARDAYERMIAAVTRAEECLALGERRVFPVASLPTALASVAEVAPILRGACALADPDYETAGVYKRFILDFRCGAGVREFVDRAGLERYARAGVATPDHTIRTKNYPLILPAPEAGGLGEFATAVRNAVAAYAADYRAYFARHNAGQSIPKRELDPIPRVTLVPGLGLFGLGPTARDAVIAADIAESWVETVVAAEAAGGFESFDEAELFEMEYWSLEQAKLDTAAADRPLAGQVALVTGGAGTIGLATARAMRRAGAEIVLLDLAGSEPAAATLGGLGVDGDLTDPAAVRAAFDRAAARYGGVDIVVSNAGAAWQGRIGEVDEALLRKSFELNFFAHQSVAQNAVRIMLAQGTGGCLLFNVSRQAVSPGPDFGPYGLPKAATLALMRQYALEYAGDGIRANAVNADGIRGGLLTPDFIRQRAATYKMTETQYMSRNLLKREVTAEDVAQAFLHQALALKTTAGIATVDGGNIAAAMR